MIYAHSDPGHQTVRRRAPNRRGPARAPDRAAERGIGEGAKIDPSSPLPAGFGKTTLVSEWVAGFVRGWPVAWLSLDEGDSDLARFISYLVAALQTI